MAQRLSGSGYSIDAFDKNAWGFALHVTTGTVNADRARDLTRGVFCQAIEHGAFAHAQGACVQMRGDLVKEGLSEDAASFASGFVQPLPAALGPLLSRQENPYGASALPPDAEALIAWGIQEAFAREEARALKSVVDAASQGTENPLARLAPRL